MKNVIFKIKIKNLVSIKKFILYIIINHIIIFLKLFPSENYFITLNTLEIPFVVIIFNSFSIRGSSNPGFL